MTEINYSAWEYRRRRARPISLVVGGFLLIGACMVAGPIILTVIYLLALAERVLTGGF